VKQQEYIEHRNRCLILAAVAVEKALPEHYGSVRFNMQAGRVVNANIDESVKLPVDAAGVK